MWEEEYPLPGYQTPTEHYVTSQVIGLGILSSWLLGGDFPGGPAICAAIGAITIFFYFFYSREGAISTSPSRRYFKRWLLVPFFMIVIWGVGQFNPVVGNVLIGERDYLHMVDPGTLGPVSSNPGAYWPMLLYPCMVMLCAVGIVAFTQSQYAIGRCTMTLVISAMILGGIGLLGAVFRWDKILTAITPAQANFYSVIPAGHQWAAFALFWTVVGFGALFHLRRRTSWKSVFNHHGVWLILGWLSLAGSVYWTGAPVHRFLLGVGVGLMIFTLGIMVAEKGQKGAVKLLIGILFGLGGLALAGYSIFYFASTFTEAQTNIEQAPFGIPWAIQTALWRDSWSLVMERPYFGWGVGSFADIFSFQQQIDLHQGYYANPHSDFLKGLVEYGFVGMALWLLFPLGLMFSFIRLKIHRKLSHYLWAGATLLALLALVSQPLSTPANFVAIWIGIAMAYKWSQAAQEAERVSQIIRRARPKPESQRSSRKSKRRRSDKAK